MNINSDLQTDVLKTKRLLTCGAIASPLFVVTFLIEGATRADYNPLQHPVSSLALGDFGWIQITNFIVTGLLLLAFAIGLRRALQPAFWRPLLIGVVGISLIGAGMGLSQVPGYSDFAGVFQRTSIISGLGWITMLAFYIPKFLPEDQKGNNK